MKLYPAFLKIEGQTCLVVGGGRVAARKCRALLQAGARVVVLSAALQDELQTLLAQDLITSIPQNYAAEYIPAEIRLVFAATNDPTVNLQIARDAHARGLWVNIADNPAESDFYVPATISHQNLTLAISTGGGSPAFARYVREMLERSLNEALGQTLELLTQARPFILAAAKEQQPQLWQSLLALHLETVIETQGYPAAQRLFAAWLEQATASTQHERT